MQLARNLGFRVDVRAKNHYLNSHTREMRNSSFA